MKNGNYYFAISGTTFLTERHVKSLGKIFNSSLIDTLTIWVTIFKLELWLAKMDKSGLLGCFKAWLYQHAVLPQILWPLFIYDFPIISVEAMEKISNGYFHRWLGLSMMYYQVLHTWGKSETLSWPRWARKGTLNAGVFYIFLDGVLFFLVHAWFLPTPTAR